MHRSSAAFQGSLVSATALPCPLHCSSGFNILPSGQTGPSPPSSSLPDVMSATAQSQGAQTQRPPGKARYATSCTECRRRKQKVCGVCPLDASDALTSRSAPGYLGAPTQSILASRCFTYAFLCFFTLAFPNSWSISMLTTSLFFSLQCSQGQPCTNCLRRFPQTTCEYTTGATRRYCFTPIHIREISVFSSYPLANTLYNVDPPAKGLKTHPK